MASSSTKKELTPFMKHVLAYDSLNLKLFDPKDITKSIQPRIRINGKIHHNPIYGTIPPSRENLDFPAYVDVAENISYIYRNFYSSRLTEAIYIAQSVTKVSNPYVIVLDSFNDTPIALDNLNLRDYGHLLVLSDINPTKGWKFPTLYQIPIHRDGSGVFNKDNLTSSLKLKELKVTVHAYVFKENGSFYQPKLIWDFDKVSKICRGFGDVADDFKLEVKPENIDLIDISLTDADDTLRTNANLMMLLLWLMTKIILDKDEYIPSKITLDGEELKLAVDRVKNCVYNPSLLQNYASYKSLSNYPPERPLLLPERVADASRIITQITNELQKS